MLSSFLRYSMFEWGEIGKSENVDIVVYSEERIACQTRFYIESNPGSYKY